MEANEVEETLLFMGLEKLPNGQWGISETYKAKHGSHIEVVKDVSEATGVTYVEMCSRRIQANVIEARALCMLILREQGFYWVKIGELFNRSPHNAMHSAKRLKSTLQVTPGLYGRFKTVLDKHGIKIG
jgi:chromosomal replication initiation ATPase DnaA